MDLKPSTRKEKKMLRKMHFEVNKKTQRAQIVIFSFENIVNENKQGHNGIRITRNAR